jgi:hypothetical protein
MSSSSRLYVLPFFVLLLFVFLPCDAVAEENPWSGKVRPGFITGNSDVGTDFNIDILLPLYGDERQIFFFNPNFRIDDNDGNEQNIGFGYRLLSSCGHFILGGNAYYDTMESETGHRYEQWGVGAEILSQWVDLRGNYYDVFGDTVNSLGTSSSGNDGYYFSGNSLIGSFGVLDEKEEALDGYDLDISVLVPRLSDFMETRLGATYYRFDSSFGEDPDGWRGRIEARPVQALNLIVEYRDDDLRGSDTFYGGYLEIPFSLDNLLSGKNPFEGAGEHWAFGKGARKLQERMTDKVVRDRHIVAVQTKTDTRENVTVVDDAMIFVNQDNSTAGDGTYENPYQTLDQAATDERFQPGAWLYVFSSDDTADTYADTHFTLLDDMVLWGQGYTHPVYGMGGGPAPVLDGGYSEVPAGVETADPVIWLANNNEIMGLVIQRGLEGIYLDSRLEGKTTQSVNIHDNIIRDNLSPAGDGSGIHISNIFDADDLGGTTLHYFITDNLIDNNDRAGIYIRHEANNGELVGTTFETTISGNTILNHTDAAFVSLYVDGSDPTLIQDVRVSNLLENNTIQDNQRGIRIYNTLNARTNVPDMYVANINSQIINTIRNNDVSNFSAGHGIYVDNQINAQTYLNSLVQQAQTSNLLENNIVAGAYSGIYVRNFSFSGGDFNNVTAETRFLNNNVSVEEPQYTGTYGIFVSNDFHKNGALAQGPIAASVFGQANSIDDLSTTAGLVTGVRLLASARTLGSVDDFTTAIIQDFGGGTLNSTGNNSFTGASGSDKAFSIGSGLFDVTAENNWWGTTDAVLIDAMIEATGSGSVDYEPYLLSAP